MMLGSVVIEAIPVVLVVRLFGHASGWQGPKQDSARFWYSKLTTVDGSCRNMGEEWRRTSSHNGLNRGVVTGSSKPSSN